MLNFYPPVLNEKNFLIAGIAEVSFYCQLIIRVGLYSNSE